MNRFFRTLARACTALGVLTLAGALLTPVHAQSWPTKPLRLVVPYAPGGPTDLIARLLSKHMASALGQSVVVDNKAGAGGTIGVASVLKSEPDGYTLALVAPGPISGMPNLMKLPYGPDDILYVTLVARTPSVIVVQTSAGINSLADLVREAKSKPGKLNYGSAGVGTTPHLGVELLKHEAGIDMVHVAYKGAGPALTALLGGEVQMVMLDILPTLPHVTSGRLKVLAPVSEHRVPQIPDIPTTVEQGYPRVVMDAHYGVIGPKGLAPEVQKRLRDAVAAALNAPEMKAEMVKLGAVALTSTSSEYQQVMRADYEKWKRVIEKSKITLD